MTNFSTADPAAEGGSCRPSFLSTHPVRKLSQRRALALPSASAESRGRSRMRTMNVTIHIGNRGLGCHRRYLHQASGVAVQGRFPVLMADATR